MSVSHYFGFAGDFLTFVGGVILALDALFGERKLMLKGKWEATLESPELAKVVMTREGVKLKTKDDVEHSFVRQSTRWAAIGAGILAIGFASLFISRFLEVRAESPPEGPHSIDIHA